MEWIRDQVRLPPCDGGFEVVWQVEGLYRVTFEVYQALILGSLYAGGEGPVGDFAQAEIYLSGFIKWDGCAHLQVPNAHVCGRVGWSEHLSLLAYLWRRAGEILPPNIISEGEFAPLAAPTRLARVGEVGT